MPSNSWNQTVTRTYTSGSALSNTTTPTSLLPAGEKIVLPANYFFPGIRYKVRAAGKISTAASSPGTLTLDVKLGSTTVFSGGASGTLVTSQSNATWVYDADLVCLSYGASTSATLQGTGVMLSPAVSSTSIQLLPASSPGAGTGFDSTASQQLDFYATWSVANASNSIQLLDFKIILEN